MYQGDEDNKWAAAMHRDIKDGNIFLVEARDDFSRRMEWPTPVMGDYDLAAPYPIDNPDDGGEENDEVFGAWLGPHLARLGQIGTPGHIAPESL
jgi:serine/threonine protein kinase